MPFPSQPLRPRFLLGPAGSGKTHRCLAEIRSELARSPSSQPLLLLAPKQATYQLERQLLETAELKGWSRLQILSFERLAMQVLDNTEYPAREILREEGRVMVLRALLQPPSIPAQGVPCVSPPRWIRARPERDPARASTPRLRAPATAGPGPAV